VRSFEEADVVVHPSFDYQRTFLAVYRAGSLTAAARVVDISQPAVSGQIQALERQLGFTLFLRRGRGIEPTARAVDLAREVAEHLPVEC
jgi:DNA-binding transcriptional LysR family regulator